MSRNYTFVQGSWETQHEVVNRVSPAEDSPADDDTLMFPLSHTAQRQASATHSLLMLEMASTAAVAEKYQLTEGQSKWVLLSHHSLLSESEINIVLLRPARSHSASMMKTTLLVMFLVTHSSAILTVSKISVQKHQTIIIPCLYNERYVSNRKYVSSGGVWLFSREVKHGRMCLADNRTEKVFTATLSSAEESDSGSYWCAIEGTGSDPHAQLHLEVIKGKARLHVSSQSVSGYEGGRVTVLCHGASLWCQIGGSCVGRDEESSDKAHVRGDGEALSVSLSELKIEDSGWYFCSDGKYQMPVHISVRKATRPVTVHYTGHTTASSQDNVAWGPGLLWRAVLGAMLPAVFCVAVALIRRNISRSERLRYLHLHLVI
ncbi:uncharacterized protein LOC130103403 [Rhinichthys klamathensis goyatoka]|uniref:uncharacterized protein LOC130103403 n=1 Tax=Rhinichthys klamathensis goyatoka TaxID=3034132 RepID=UPI0024B548ED|nr:uncharacterized protein LOC130103403 [Rhinichthys klamathensis goyatoka]